MPLPAGTIYRYKKGTKIRMAILNGRVIEVKNMETGKTETMAEMEMEAHVRAKNKKRNSKK